MEYHWKDSNSLWVGNEEGLKTGLFVYKGKKLIAGLENNKKGQHYADLFARSEDMESILGEVLAYLKGDQIRPSDPRHLIIRIEASLYPLHDQGICTP